ncbi:MULTISPECIES: ABC transporter permease [unclassified Leucobacter]|uniref:ABC transporter permease n=1 Tax=unclassified Leucobacter TaxID=2621730 RepID=UPI00165E5E4E|nr:MULTISPECIES: ABC transporter permease [unclassified Leucobacter]MBC9937599.1 ABC transporter permease [Leucobacter sp. cx-87]
MSAIEPKVGLGLRLWAVLVGTILFAPLAIVVPLSFTAKRSFKFPPDGLSLEWYRNFFTDDAWLRALGNSLWIGLVVALLCTVLGTLAALGIQRLPGKIGGIVQGLLLAPLIIPGIVSAVAIYSVFLKWKLSGNPLGFVLAHAVLAIPFVVVTVSASLSSYDQALDRAAASLGAGRLRTFARVTLPLIAPGVGAGALFAFITSFDEVVAAMFLQSPKIRTLPVEMFVSVTNEVDPTIAVVSTLILAVTSAVVLVPALTRSQRR